MNNPIFNDTIKLVDNLRNSKGEYSPKNKSLVEMLEKCLSLKSIGCNFVIALEFGNDKAIKAKGGEFVLHHSPSDLLKVADIANLLMCLNVTMKDRVFYLSNNKENKLMITCVSMKYFPETIFVRDKDATTNSTIEAINCFDGTKSKITVSQSKGKRPINADEISQLTTVFNTMLKVGYNKELAVKVENKKTA